MVETSRASLTANEVAELDPYNIRTKEPRTAAEELLSVQNEPEINDVKSQSFEEVLPMINSVAGKLADDIGLRDIYYSNSFSRDLKPQLEWKNLMKNLLVKHRIVLGGAIGKLYRAMDRPTLGEIRQFNQKELVDKTGVSERTAFVVFNTFKKS